MGYTQTYTCNIKYIQDAEETKLNQNEKLELKIQEIEEKIIALDGLADSELEVDVHKYFHCSFNEKDRLGIDSNAYEKAFFIHEKGVKRDRYVLMVFNEHNGKWDSYEVEQNFQK